MNRREFLTVALAGTVGALVPFVGVAQQASHTAGAGALVQLTLDVQGMH